MRKLVAIALVTALPLSGCADLSPTRQRALTGTGIGAAGAPLLARSPGMPAWARASARPPASAAVCSSIRQSAAKQRPREGYASALRGGLRTRRSRGWSWSGGKQPQHRPASARVVIPVHFPDLARSEAGPHQFVPEGAHVAAFDRNHRLRVR